MNKVILLLLFVSGITILLGQSVDICSSGCFIQAQKIAQKAKQEARRGAIKTAIVLF